MLEKQITGSQQPRWLTCHLMRCLVLAAAVLHHSVLIGGVPTRPLPTLTTAHAAHSLTSAESMRAYPVHLTAVVTYYDPFIDRRHPATFVHDSTGCIFVVLSPPEIPFRAGDLLDIQGVSAPGEFAPIVVASGARFIRHSHVPSEAPPASMTLLRTARNDGQWVSVEGIVRSVQQVDRNVNLDVAMSNGSVIATSVRDTDTDYSHLIDAKVRIHANQAPLFNAHRQMTGVRLFFSDLRQVTVEEPALADPFAAPEIPVDLLLRYSPDATFQHRVHVRGRVSLQWRNRLLCIDEHGHGLCVQTMQTTPLAEGETVDVAGFPAMGGLTPTMADTIFRSARGIQPLIPASINAAQALQGDYDARLVRIEGKLIGFDRAAKEPTMMLSSGKFLFPVVLPDRSWDRGTSLWEEGSLLQVTGICSVSIEQTTNLREGFAVPSWFRILLRSPQDILVVQSPSWWTAAHLLPVLAGVLVLSLCALGWVAVLRSRINGQTVVIREQNAILSELSFQDGLTGIANRRRFDETLKTEFGNALQSATPVSLLMVDIDYFKALNDDYGHQCGDECLVRVANTLVSASVRKADLVTRYGGEEFAVILPGCVEADAVAIAERMRTAVLDLAIANARSPFNCCVSISIGVATVLPSRAASPASLLAMADSALYKSKLLGRNRTTSSATSVLELQSA